MGTGSGPAIQNPDDIDDWPVPVPIISQTLRLYSGIMFLAAGFFGTAYGAVNLPLTGAPVRCR